MIFPSYRFIKYFYTSNMCVFVCVCVWERERERERERVGKKYEDGDLEWIISVS